MAERKPFVVVCVPAFNEEGSIAGVVVRHERNMGYTLMRCARLGVCLEDGNGIY